MRRIVLGLMLVAGPALADDWRVLDGAAITGALTSRVIAYDEEGPLQDFFADGRTLKGEVLGRWKVEADRLCTQMPDRTDWTCVVVESEARGLRLRFTGPDGVVLTGTYVDLN